MDTLPCPDGALKVVEKLLRIERRIWLCRLEASQDEVPVVFELCDFRQVPSAIHRLRIAWTFPSYGIHPM